MDLRVPALELQRRMTALRANMNRMAPDWTMAVLMDKMNLYYMTGTIQDGMLMIPREGEPVFWVRRSFERAVDESCFVDIRSMDSFRDAAAAMPPAQGKVHIEAEVLPVAMLKRFTKYFPYTDVQPLDGAVAFTRSVKSEYERAWMRESGALHCKVMEEVIPSLLREGMTEVELAADLYAAMLRLGHRGVARFSMFGIEVPLGITAFGENSLYPTAFDGPGGNLGMSPAAPQTANGERHLKRGDLVFVDIAAGVNGYHTDRTQVYLFGRHPTETMLDVQRRCADIQDKTAAMLLPGALPETIYQTVMAGQDDTFLKDFMGFGKRRAKFLGHGIGLQVDEYPVIAEGFKAPLQENMVIALEPKKGLVGEGMVGVENTFLVTPKGGVSLTGYERNIMVVDA